MSESFLSIMGLLRNMPVGNPSQIVSCPAWDTVHHTHRKPSRCFSGPGIAIVTGPCKML